MSHNSSFKINTWSNDFPFPKTHQHKTSAKTSSNVQKKNFVCVKKSTHSKYHWGIEMCKHMLQNINII